MPSSSLAFRAQQGGNLLWRAGREFCVNSAHFPVLLALLEINQKGFAAYFANPSHWALILAGAVQALVLARLEPAPRALFFGNLAGVGFYTAVDLFKEGMEFFEGPEHLAYWGFSLLIGGLQAGRRASERRHPRLADGLRISENTARTMIIPAVYFISELWAARQGFAEATVSFFEDATHNFIVQAIFLIGILYGASEVLLARHRAVMFLLIERLQRFSSWFVEPGLMESLVERGGEAPAERAERTVLFMDIRGFTRWSSAQGGPQVGGMLNGYYEKAGPVVAAHGGLMTALTGDEVMAIFREPGQAVACALALQEAVRPHLAPYGLGAGIGLHCGEVVEGLFGTSNKKVFSVMGMPVNIAKRLEGCAEAGKVVVSEELWIRIQGEGRFAASALPVIPLKGVPEPMRIYEISANP